MKISLLVLVLPSAVAQFQQFGGQKNCPEFTCPKNDETPVPKFPMKLTSTGCSSIGGGGMAMMGGKGTYGETAINPCCDLYHSCLQICGSTKSFCDSNLEVCMEKKCDSLQNASAKKECETAISTKKIMLQISTCAEFNTAQKENCECVKKDEVSEKRSEVVSGFYKKFNPSAAEKAGALAAKATDSKKLAGLLFKLVEKYPKAIKKVKDPKQKMMEDMMSDGKFKLNGEGSVKRNVDSEENIKVDDIKVDDSDDSEERIEL
mmetsp:Transcript_4758/g.7218  ORF Transcript_4758/g.7218 Transcript_4758/m.7218 type:complete len:262 (+) Transcript_4758:120-905(+)